MEEEFKNRISSIRGKEMKIIYLDLINNKIEDINDETIYIVYGASDYKKVIEKVGEHKSVYIFNDEDISFCPVDNKNVPKHTLVENPEELIKRYKNLKFPRILFEDPIVKWYGWKCGSYIRIERDHGEVYYRHLYCSEHSPIS